MAIGISVYGMTAPDLLDLAVAADEFGFDAIWLGEHVVLPVGYGAVHPTAGTDDHQHIAGPIVASDTELLDPLVALGAVAGATVGLRLATGIFLLPLRHPLVTARAVQTLQEMSGGRVLLGLGAGWLAEEFDALDVPFAERFGRFTEAIDIVRRAWIGGPFDYHGKHYAFELTQVCSRPVDVPLILGGNTKRALDRAALLGDGWFSSGTPSFDEARRLRDALGERRSSLGCDGPFRCYFRIERNDPALVKQYDAAGLDDVVIWADQLWPAGDDLAVKRDALAASAADLGLVSRSRPRRGSASPVGPVG